MHDALIGVYEWLDGWDAWFWVALAVAIVETVHNRWLIHQRMIHVSVIDGLGAVRPDMVVVAYRALAQWSLRSAPVLAIFMAGYMGREMKRWKARAEEKAKEGVGDG